MTCAWLVSKHNYDPLKTSPIEDFSRNSVSAIYVILRITVFHNFLQEAKLTLFAGD